MGIFKGKRKRGLFLTRIKPLTHNKRTACSVLTPLKSPPRKRIYILTPFKSPTPLIPKCNWTSTLLIISTPKSDKKGRKKLKFETQTEDGNSDDDDPNNDEEHTDPWNNPTMDLNNTIEMAENNEEFKCEYGDNEGFASDEDAMEHIVEMLPSVLKELASIDQVDTLYTFFKLLSEGKFPKENIAFSVWCDLVRWFDLKDTRQMRYSPNCVNFYWVGWKLFGGRFIRYISGHKNDTAYLEDEGTLDPLKSKINFPCPSENILRNHNPMGGILDKEMPPGILEDMIKLKAEKDKKDKSYVIMFDGKKVRTGGDVDLLGHERGPTVKERKSIRDQGLKLIEESMSLFRSIGDNVDETDGENQRKVYSMLTELLRLFSETLKKLRFLKKDKDSYLQRLKEKAGNDWRGSKYVYAIDSCYTLLYRIQNAIDKSISIIRAICKTGAYLNKVGHLFAKSETIDLGSQINVRILKSPEDAKKSLETGTIETDITKQRSEEWFADRKMKKVTGSTIFAAVGCDTLKKQRQHFDEVISHVEPPPKTPEQQAAMKRGTDSEIHQIATLASVVMPFLFPETTFFEVGYYNTGNILVSPDGILKNNDSVIYAFEGKAPVGNVYTTPVHYEVPLRYITQTLFEQKATNAEKGTLYCSWSPQSTTIFLVPQNDELCDKIESELDSVYEQQVPRRPTRLSRESKEIKGDLNAVVKQCEFIGEFPSVQGVFNTDSTRDQPSPYYLPDDSLESLNHLTYDDILRSMHLGKEVIVESYELHRQSASQVIVVLLADLDRLWKPEEPHAVPIMYFFRGYSLSMDIMRKLLDSCKEACERHNLDIRVCSSDGEFVNLMVKDKNGKPRTLNQLSKDLWAEANSMKKNEIIEKFVDMTKHYDHTTERKSVTNLIGKEDTIIATSVFSTNETFGKVRTVAKGWKVGKKDRTTEKDGDHSDIQVDNDIDLQTNDSDDDIRAPADDMPDEVLNPEQNQDNTGIDNEEDGITNDLYDGNGHPSSTSDIVTATVQRKHIILTPRDYTDILYLLKSLNEKKWSETNSTELASAFKTSSTLNKFVVKELLAITKFVNIKPEMADRQLRVTKVTKVDLVNQLSNVLADGSQLEKKKKERKKKKKGDFPKLNQLAENALMKKKYPKLSLVISYCESVWSEIVSQWRISSRVNDEIELVGLNESFCPYYVPEFDEQREKFHVYVYDKTHLGSNLRKALCLDKVHGVSKESWIKVAESDPQILNPTLLEVSEEGKILDQMREQLAKTMLSSSVECKMLENGDKNEAEFCAIMRNALYIADDEPGVSAIDRCEKRLRLIHWLDKDVNFGQFPPYGSHIKGLSHILYEGLRTSQEAKLYLYAITKKKTYCVRAPNTLCSESFFSTMQEMDPWGQGVLTTTGVKKHISDFTTITAMKMDENRYGYRMFMPYSEY